MLGPIPSMPDDSEGSSDASIMFTSVSNMLIFNLVITTAGVVLSSMGEYLYFLRLHIQLGSKQKKLIAFALQSGAQSGDTRRRTHPRKILNRNLLCQAGGRMYNLQSLRKARNYDREW